MAHLHTPTPHVNDIDTAHRPLLSGLRPDIARSVRGRILTGLPVSNVTPEQLAEAQRILRTQQRNPHARKTPRLRTGGREG